MNKIPTMFLRDPQDRSRVLMEVHPDCQWVLDGEGIATRKYEGTSVMLDESGRWWARREVKKGKTAPPNYLYISTDPISGAQMGYEPMSQSSYYKQHIEAVRSMPGKKFEPGTYELIGPKINGNPERVKAHTLVMHDEAESYAPLSNGRRRTLLQIKELTIALGELEGWEGIVFHHQDGQRMAKIKFRDFKHELVSRS
jgi:hypothetical protein